MLTSKKCALLLIPGIGGHPNFHLNLINNLLLSGNFSVVSFPHGDFNQQPFNSVSHHVEYWNRIISKQLLENQITGLIAISFGTVIVQSLPKSLLQKISFIFFVSPITANFTIKGLVNVLKYIKSKYMIRLFGRLFFWWSLRESHDKISLLANRSELYSDIDVIYEGLWKRFLCIRDLIHFKTFSEKRYETPIGIVFGTKEISRFFFSKSWTERDTVFYYLIEGDHSQSINDSKELVDKFKMFYFNLYGKNI